MPAPKASTEWFCVAGQDLARYRDYSAFVALKVVEGKAAVKKLYVWPHVRYEVVMSETMQFLTKYRVRAFAVDTTNDAKVGEDYESMGAPIQKVKFTLGSKQDMVEYFRDVLGKKLLMLPTKGPFVSQLRSELAEQERLGGAAESRGFGSETAKFAHPEGQHDDLFWSLMLATRAASPWLTAKIATTMATFEPMKAADRNIPYWRR